MLGRTGPDNLLDYILNFLLLVRVDFFPERDPFQLLLGMAEHFLPGRIELANHSIKPRDREHIDRKGEKAILFGLKFKPARGFAQCPLVRLFFNTPELFGLPLGFLSFLEKLDEDRNLAAQDVGHDRREYVIDRAK